MSKNLLEVINSKCTEEEIKQIGEAELVKQLLEYCSIRPGADIQIVVKHNDGHTATANLYDLAAFVQPLYVALEEFQQELL